MVRRTGDDALCELYDLAADPGESDNRYKDPELQAVVKQLSGEIDRYFGRYQDPIKNGLRVKELPRHNMSEAWRIEDDLLAH